MFKIGLLSAALLIASINAGETVPLEMTLTSHRSHYAVDRGGKTIEEYTALLKTGVAPYGPAIVLMVELRNTTDKEIIAYGNPRPHFLLKGPRAESVVEVAPTKFQCPPSRRYVIGAGKSAFLNVISFFNPEKDEPSVKDTVKRLAYSDGPALQCVNWTEPGEYTLNAELELGLTPAPAGAKPFEKKKYNFAKIPDDIGVVKVRSNSIKLTIKEGSDTAYWGEALEDADAEVRFVAAHTLTAAIPLSEDTRNKMAKRVQDSDVRVRRSAARALQRPENVKPDATVDSNPAVIGLLTALKDANPGVRNFAVAALSTWGRTVKASASALVPMLQDADFSVRVTVAEALGELFHTGGAPEPIVIPALIAALKDADERVQTAAITALGRLKSNEAIPALTALCNQPSTNVCKAAIDAIGEIGPPPANSAEEALFLALKKDATRSAAASSLGQIKADPTKLLPALAQALKVEEEGFGRVAIIRAFGTCGKPAIPTLLQVLTTDKDATVREYAAAAIAGLGAIDKSSVPELIVGLKDSNEDVLGHVATALGNIGAPAAEAAPALKALSTHKSETVRGKAAQALNKIEVKRQ